MYNGILNIYKEAGFTSFDVVAKLRGILKTKKIGHTGTLDPDAVGVLPVCVGSATKLVDLLTDKSKEYIAVMRFGVVTDTQDMSGKIIGGDPEAGAKISSSDVRNIIPEFIGEIMQVPPMYSALKVDGRKLCDLARAGIEVERKARKITIDEIELLGESEDSDGTRLIKIRVACSKGTYIRTLIHDMGQKLGPGAAMVSLVRTKVGSFKVEDALKICEIESAVKQARGETEGCGERENAEKQGCAETENAGLHNIIIPIESVFADYKELRVTEYGEKALKNGNILRTDMVTGEGFENSSVYRMYNYVNRFCALYKYEQDGNILIPVKMFLN